MCFASFCYANKQAAVLSKKLRRINLRTQKLRLLACMGFAGWASSLAGKATRNPGAMEHQKAGMGALTAAAIDANPLTTFKNPS